MTRLLVSVRSASEARAAIAAGAELIDVKEPSRGPLGAADPDTWDAVHSVAAGRLPVSVALGELLYAPATRHADRLGGVQFAKLGLSGCAECDDWRSRWSAAMEQLPEGVGRVAVAYADARRAHAPPPRDVLRAAVTLGCHALLIDTFHKNNGALFDAFAPQDLAELVGRAQSHNLVVVLGGSLGPRDVTRACRLRPDYIAVRGAVCRGGRRQTLQGALVRRLADQLACHDETQSAAAAAGRA